MVVVVPCYNEADRLRPDAFATAVDADPSLQFVFVDDGSDDGTARVLAELAARAPGRLHAVTLDRNRGKASAVRAGMIRAFDMRPDLVGYFDADLATPIAELRRMADAFDDSRVLAVLGARVAMLGRSIVRSPRRHYLGRVFATLASFLLGLRVYDTQCGAKLFRCVPALRELFDEPFLSPWAFDVEILARLLRLERRNVIAPVTGVVVEVPLRQWTGVRGSKLSVRAALVTVGQLLRIWWHYRH